MKDFRDARLLDGGLPHPLFNDFPQRLSKRLQPLLVITILIFSQGTLAAEDGALTLESAMELTLAQNPQLRVFDFRDEALQGQAETAAGVMALYQRLLSYGLPTDIYSGYGTRLAALSGTDVARAAAKLARPEALTWFVVGDLAKIETDIRKLKLGPVTVLDARGEKLR